MVDIGESDRPYLPITRTNPPFSTITRDGKAGERADSEGLARTCSSVNTTAALMALVVWHCRPTSATTLAPSATCGATPDGFVSITTITQFEIEAAQLEERVKDGEAPHSALRAFGVSSSVASIDKQGRITLDEESRTHAGIAPGGQAVIAGAVNKLEVWRPSRYQTIRGEDTVVEPARVWVDEENGS